MMMKMNGSQSLLQSFCFNAAIAEWAPEHYSAFKDCRERRKKWIYNNYEKVLG